MSTEHAEPTTAMREALRRAVARGSVRVCGATDLVSDLVAHGLAISSQPYGRDGWREALITDTGRQVGREEQAQEAAPRHLDLGAVAAHTLTTLGHVAADDLGPVAALDLLAHDTNPVCRDEWWHRSDGGPAGWGPPRRLAEGYPQPDVDGHVARVHRGINRDELPGLIGFLTAVLAAQDDHPAPVASDDLPVQDGAGEEA